MKRISVYAFAFVAVTQLLALTASAQEKKEKREKEEKKEQIIIRKKGDKTEKTTIVIEGDKVTVNGKPVEKGDKDIIIHRFDGDDEFVFRSPKMRVIAPRMYKGGPEGWGQFNSDDFMKEFKMTWKTGAFLGVVTEDHDKGALVEEVQKETPAEKAGLQKGDIITKVGDKKIESPSDLSEAVHAKKPNDEVDITYLRDGKEKKTKVKLGESKGGPQGMQNFNFHMPDMPGFGEHQFNFEHLQPRLHGLQDQIRIYQGGRPKFGATIQDTEEGNGVKVLEVEANSPSAKSGLQKDDIITEVNGKAVKNVAEAREALRANNEQNLWTVKVLRAGKPVTVEVKIPKKLNKADL